MSSASPIHEHETDLIVIGAGAAGMTAALVAAVAGLRVVLLEKSAQVGGTSARSAGTLWVPGNHFMSEPAAALDINEARQYLNNLIQDADPTQIREAFLEQAPNMLKYLQQHTDVRFKACPHHADYHPEVAGSRAGSRPVESDLFDARLLGKNFGLLRAPNEAFMVFGGMMVSKADINLLLQAGKHWDGTVHAARLGTRYLLDRMQYSRGTRLTMGNALCGRLLFECLKRQVSIKVNSEVRAVESTGGKSYRVQIRSADGVESATTRLGVIFAGGGFSGDAQSRRKHLPSPTPLQTAAFEGADGSSQALAMSLGARLGPSCQDNAWWFPASLLPRAGRNDEVFPHIIMDRAKPGLIAVNQQGNRFANEGLSYHQFARRQYACSAIPCWLVCDATFIRRYGLGAVRPGASGLRAALRSGYIKRGETLSALAKLLNIDAAGLLKSAERMTQFAQTGVDEDFGKGGDSLSRQNGDPTHDGPNPCLGPLEKAPFYAVQVTPTDLGTSRGLLTDVSARLLDQNDQPIAGLYACGNDMHSLMAGQYPAPGVTLGPGMTFGYIAARNCADMGEMN